MTSRELFTPLEDFEPFWRKIKPYIKWTEFMPSSYGYSCWPVNLYFISGDVLDAFRGKFTAYKSAVSYAYERDRMGISIEYGGDGEGIKERLGI
jgi:hypothetical protein